MSSSFDNIVAAVSQDREQTQRLMDKIFSAAQPDAVFAQPVTASGYTVINACEVVVGGGVGYGVGGGTGSPETSGQPGSQAGASGASQPSGGGGGAGGGGSSSGRPVAAIVIGPDGVKVKPVIDVTKLLIAFFTAWGAMGLMMARMMRASRARGGRPMG